MESSVVSASTAPFCRPDRHAEYVGYCSRLAFGASLSWTFCAEVEPVTEHSFLEFRSEGDLMELSSARSSTSWWASRYGPAKSTFASRFGVIEYVAAMKSTSPRCSMVSRSALFDSFHSIWSAL